MKRILSLVLVIVLCLGYCLPAAAAGTEKVDITYRAIRIVLNGEEIIPCDGSGKTVEPFIMNSNGTTYLPLRAIGQALGLFVGWNPSASTVELNSGGVVKTGSDPAGSTKGTEKVAITYRDIKVFLNGTQLELKNVLGQTVEPFILNSNSSVYLPLRIIGEAFGLEVKWEPSSSTVYLDEPVPTAPLSIISYVPDAEAKAGDSLSFSFNVAGGTAPYSYQWQCIWDGAEEFENINSSCKDWASGWDTDTLNLTVGESDFTYNYRYRLVVTDARGNTAVSNEIGLILKVEEEPLTILTQPRDVYVISGDKAIFNCLATGGSGELEYRWQILSTSGGSRWSDCTCLGADSPTMTMSINNYMLTPVGKKDGGYMVRCVVTDEKGNTLTSGSAMLYEAFAITDEPSNVKMHLKDGETKFTSVSVGVSTKDETVKTNYRWQYSSNFNPEWRDMDNGSWSLATTWNSSELIFRVSQSLIDGGYKLRCIISGEGEGSITTRTVYILDDPLSAYIGIARNTPLYVEAYCSATGGSGGYSYQWYYKAPGSGNWLITAMTEKYNIPWNEYGSYYCLVTDSNGETVKTEVVEVAKDAFY